MKIKSLLLPLLALATAGCSENSNDEAYQSALPVVSSLKVEKASGADGAIHVGDQVKVTAVQGTKGRLLNRTTYTWTAQPLPANGTKTVVYDKENGDPTWTFTATEAGDVTIQFKGEYSASGASWKAINRSQREADTTVTYTASALSGRVVATRTFRILP